MLLPYSLADATVRRWPVITFVLLALNAVCFLGELAATKIARGDLARDYRGAAEYALEHKYLNLPPLLARGITVAGVSHALPHEDVPANLSEADLEEEQQRLNRLCARVEDELSADPTQRFGFIPRDGASTGILTHMFLHGGWLHLIGNMWFLWLASACIEDRWGRPAFTVFYLASGVVAAMAHMMSAPSSPVPLVGASGAIAGAMGAFLVLFATKRIRFFYFFGLRFGEFAAPAYLMLPLWLVAQLFFGSFLGGDGVAYWAHVGGFVFGAAVAFALRMTGADAWLDRRVEDAID